MNDADRLAIDAMRAELREWGEWLARADDSQSDDYATGCERVTYLRKALSLPAFD